MQLQVRGGFYSENGNDLYNDETLMHFLKPVLHRQKIAVTVSGGRGMVHSNFLTQRMHLLRWNGITTKKATKSDQHSFMKEHLGFVRTIFRLHVGQITLTEAQCIAHRNFDLLYSEILSPTLTSLSCPVGWGCRIHRLLLCRGVRPFLTSVLDMTLNNLMVRLQQCWSFGECGVPLHCHRAQVHSGPEW